MKFRLILEGTDCVGKTTLANYIADNIPNVKVIHFSKPDFWFDPWYDHIKYFKWYDNYNLILDRFFYGEVVYSRYFNRKILIDDKLFARLEERCLEEDNILLATIIRDIPDLKQKYEMKKQKGEEFMSFEDIVKVQNLFIELHSKSKLPKTLINLSYNENLKSVFKRLKINLNI